MRSYLIAGAVFLILAGQPTRAAAVLIPRAAPEAVASLIIPNMLATHWRLVSESPHTQIWERPSSNKVVNFFGALTDLDTHVPVDRVSYTIASAQGGTLVQSTYALIMAPGSRDERVNAFTGDAYEAKMQKFLDAVRDNLSGSPRAPAATGAHP